MAATTDLDAMCVCASPAACHRTEMRWGERVRTTCRHCPCVVFRPAPPSATPPAAPLVCAYEAWACVVCGSRYGRPYDDHPCGPLVAVLVTITRREVPS
jgi:hypothetical protein